MGEENKNFECETCNDDVCDIFDEDGDVIVHDEDEPKHDFIYTVTVLCDIRERITSDGRKSGFPEFGDSRVVGYYFDFDDAVNAVLENWGDIHEGCYNYAVVEKVEAGLYRPAASDDRLVFKWDHAHDTYYQMLEEPKVLRHVCGISIG